MSLTSLEQQAVEQFTREFEALFDAGMASFYAEDVKLLRRTPSWSAAAARSSNSGRKPSAGPGWPAPYGPSAWTR
jgi:hypothetical protein